VCARRGGREGKGRGGRRGLDSLGRAGRQGGCRALERKGIPDIYFIFLVQFERENKLIRVLPN
jgi:hypothetical protein